MSGETLVPVVTIDGPSASGKSSVSRDLARKMGWSWVSTGAFYRGLAWVANAENVASDNVEALVKLVTSSVWKVQMEPDRTRVYWRDSEVTDQIYSEETGEKASQISRLPEVREALLQPQRQCAIGVAGLVAEGRDCGSVVFPQALLKVYLTASQQARALRRAKEQNLDVEKTEASQKMRDRQDSTRTAAPLQIPADGLVLDTDNMSLGQVVDRIAEWLEEAMARGVKSF